MKILKSIALLVILGLLVVVCLGMPPALNAADKSTLDNEAISKLLADAKTQAIDLKKAAEQLESFTRTKASWESHAGMIEKMKEQINETGKLLAKMTDLRSSGTPWQQQAIDQITPLLKELATNTTATIDHLKANRSRLNTPEYRDYVIANYDVATELTALISDFVDYGRTKARLENLTNKLEIER